MTKTINPFRVIEAVGRILFWAFWVALGLFLLVALPILGFIVGEPWYVTWGGYLISAAYAFVLYLALFVSENWDDWKRKWDA